MANAMHYKAKFDEALRLRDTGRLPEAIQLLTEIIEETDEPNAAFFGTLGHLYRMANDFAAARDCFEKATRLKPTSELASLGLFHSLWDMGEIDAAFDEMRRFLSVAESEEYSTLLADWAKAKESR